MSKFTISSSGRKKGFQDGYIDNVFHAGTNNLCPPSKNCVIDKDGVVETRPGYLNTTIDLSTNVFSTIYYMESFDLTFFASGTKVYYVEGQLTAGATLIDTGITLTAGTTTRFDEYNGVVYLTNSTDGAYGIMVTRLNGAVSSGAGTIVTDVSGAGLASVFDTQLSPGTKNLRINGTNEQYASITVSTGTFTLSGTSSQAYADNTIATVVYNLTAVIPKASKIIPWKESLNAIGVSVDDTTGSGDRRETAIYFSQFATAATAEASVTWSGGTAGSELVGKSGRITNALATRDYLYIFKEGETYWIPVSSVNASSGARPPQILSRNYGCINEDCAAEMEGTVPFLTNNNRIIAIRIENDSGAAVVFPDESFDVPISNTLDLMDEDQTGAHMFYHKGERRLYVQVKIANAWKTLVYDNKIKKWLPPWGNYVFKAYTERKGVAYATAIDNDTIYEIGAAMNDDGIDIQTVAATTRFEFEDGRQDVEWQEVELSGEITQPAEITVEIPIDGGSSVNKTITATGLNFNQSDALGESLLGEQVIGGNGGISTYVQWEKRFGVYPAYGSDLQIKLSTVGDGAAFKWRGYTIQADTLDSLLTLS